MHVRASPGESFSRKQDENGPLVQKLGPGPAQQQALGNHGDSRMANELGNCFISCGETEPSDPVAGVALLLSPRCACAVVDKGHV